MQTPSKIKPLIVTKAESIVLHDLRAFYGGDAVFAKIRLADIFDMDDGIWRAEGLDNFMWMAHVDFLIVDREFMPSLVVEVDESTHVTKEQKDRDEKKDEVCRLANLPIHRIPGYAAMKQAGRNVVPIKEHLYKTYIEKCEEEEIPGRSIMFIGELYFYEMEMGEGRVALPISEPHSLEYYEAYTDCTYKPQGL
jgi:hypothetical protein